METEFKKYCEEKRGYRPWTTICAVNRFKLYLRWLNNREMNRETVEEFLSELRQRVKPVTIRDYIENFKRVEGFLEDKGKPTVLIKNYRLPRISEPFRVTYTREEALQIINTEPQPKIESARSYTAERRNSIAIAFLFFTGCRLSEMRNLTWQYVDLQEGSATFIERKNYQNQTIFIVNPLLAWIKELSVHAVPTATVFQGSRGNPIDSSVLRASLKKRAKLCGITKRVHAHGFRYTYGSSLWEDGSDIYLIKNVLGHKDIRTTEKYIITSKPVVKKAMQSHPHVRDGLDYAEFIYLIENKLRDVLSSFNLQKNNKVDYNLIQKSFALFVDSLYQAKI